MKCGICNKEYVPDGLQSLEEVTITYSNADGKKVNQVWKDICSSCRNEISSAFFRCVNTPEDIIKRMNEEVMKGE